MTTTNGVHHQQRQVTDGELFIRKIMEDDKTHFVQAERSTSQVFRIIITLFFSYILIV